MRVELTAGRAGSAGADDVLALIIDRDPRVHRAEVSAARSGLGLAGELDELAIGRREDGCLAFEQAWKSNVGPEDYIAAVVDGPNRVAHESEAEALAARDR